jgi:hypothetical protein
MWAGGKKKVLAGLGAPARSRPPAIARSLTNCGVALFFPFFWFFLIYFFWFFGDGPGILGEWVYDTPIF